MMVVQYKYITWNPPNLTQAEELELGREIALVGREHFVREFRKSINRGKPQQQKTGIAAWPTGARWTFLVVFGGLMLFGLSQMTDRDWGDMARHIIPIMVIVFSIYFASVYFATRKFERWIDRLVARYAAHVASRDKKPDGGSEQHHKDSEPEPVFRPAILPPRRSDVQ